MGLKSIYNTCLARSEEPGSLARIVLTCQNELKPHEQPAEDLEMVRLMNALNKLGIFTNDFDYHLIRASMVIICFFFGYQKWFPYEADALIPYINHGPLIFWLYPVFGIRGATYFLGGAEWLFGALLLLGFWNKKLGSLGALGFCFSMISTFTIIPFMPGGWAASAGGFPAMTEKDAFLLKDLVIFAASFYLLKQDMVRALPTSEHLQEQERRPA